MRNLARDVDEGAQFGPVRGGAGKIEKQSWLFDARLRQYLLQLTGVQILADQRFEEISNADALQRQFARIEGIADAHATAYRNGDLSSCILQVPGVGALRRYKTIADAVMCGEFGDRAWYRARLQIGRG